MSVKHTGLPGEFLFVFALLVWLLFLLILLSDRKKPLNRWCFASGICFSMGIFKEYLYYTLLPELMETEVFPLLTDSLSLQIYSILTAILFYFSIACALVFGLYLCEYPSRFPKLFRYVRILLFSPAFIFTVLVPWWETRYYQLNVPIYYLSVAVYNWLYAIILTIIILQNLHHKRSSPSYQQRYMVAIIVLFPLWYWLISIFLFRILGLTQLEKAWQGNLIIILLLLLFFLRNLFKDGIWGLRLRYENYDWTTSANLFRKNAQYISHMLKNEISKIEWCVYAMKENPVDAESKLDIILHSTAHLQRFVEKNKLYANDIILTLAPCAMKTLIQKCVNSNATENVTILVHCDENAMLICDQEHVYEVLNNLLTNAMEASAHIEPITITFTHDFRKRFALLSVADHGSGIPEEEQIHLFEPYYSTKKNHQHMGLGLYYCRHVMQRHGGFIDVKSSQDGSIFTLYFPLKRYVKWTINRSKGSAYKS